ncbi:MAG: SPOR domain-containing protein [Steroidobacteraceae bacterium]
MKERLTGAIILVVLIVLLVPELLSGPKGRTAPVPAGVAPTSSEEPPLRSYTINLGDDSHARSGSAESGGPGMPQPSGPEQPTVQPAAPTVDGATGESEAADVASQPGASQPSGAPLAASSQPPKSQAADTPQRSGTPQAASSTAGNSSAPKSQSSGAQQAAGAPQSAGASQSSNARPQSSTQTARPGEAAVPPQRTVKSSGPAQKPTPPSSAAPPRSEPPKPVRAAALEKPAKAHPAATASNAASASESPPGSPAQSWAVQLGVFASRENAERLALEVRAKGFKVSVSPVTGGSRKLFKVRVGPTPDRAAAQELQGRLKASGRPGGTVVPYS